MAMLADLFIATELAAGWERPPASHSCSRSVSPTPEQGSLGPFLQIQVDRAALQAELDAQLEVAIESVVRRRRGGRRAQLAARHPGPRAGALF